MNRYEELGFFDFEDFVEELNEEELFYVNGGACGAGSSYSPTPYYGGSCAGGGAVTPSYPSSCGGGYTPPSTPPTCGGGSINLPPQQICSNPSDYHCDIYAWNLAIKNGLDSRLGKSAEMDLNNQIVDTMYKSYYKGKEVTFSSASAGKKDMLVYDWSGTSSAKDHIEYVEISYDRKGYNLYRTDGIDTPVKEYRTFTNSPTAKADTSKGSSVVFIPLN